MCVYRTEDGKCLKYSGNGILSFCVDGPCPDEIPTNGDRIRSMTDEELENQTEFLLPCCGKQPKLKFIYGLKAWGVECAVNGHIHNTGFRSSRENAVNVWNQLISGKKEERG